MFMGMATSPTMIVGATGYIGRFVAEESLERGLQTYVLVRPRPSCLARTAAIQSLIDKGAIVIEGSMTDKKQIENILKKHGIEVVISIAGGNVILDQLILLDAIKAAGTVKRFLPSEFGHDIDRANPVEPGLTFYNQKRRVRRAIEAASVPYTYICCNSIAGWPYFDNTHPSELTPPLDKFSIYGDGTIGAYFVAGRDIGKITIRAAYDPGTVNKSVHFRPFCNFFTLNKMASLWESKIGRTLPRATITEKELLNIAKENRVPESIVAALTHDIFINGCQTNYDIDGNKDVEASILYPDIVFQTVDACFEAHALSLKQGLASPTHELNPSHSTSIVVSAL